MYFKLLFLRSSFILIIVTIYKYFFTVLNFYGVHRASVFRDVVKGSIKPFSFTEQGSVPTHCS